MKMSAPSMPVPQAPPPPPNPPIYGADMPKKKGNAGAMPQATIAGSQLAAQPGTTPQKTLLGQ